MDSFQAGKWYMLCDRCQFKRLAPDEIAETWDHFFVCAPSTGKTCWESRHPQDFVRGRKDDITVPYTRPEPANVFRSTSPIASSVGVQETTVPTVTPGNGSAR